MIFVTVGSQLPFERLVQAVDRWAAASSSGTAVQGQIGAAPTSPEHFSASAELTPAAFNAAVEQSTVIVGHAGTGTIMAALCAGKPVVVLARREALQETRNDHQVATLERFQDQPGFFGTTDAQAVPGLIDAALDYASSNVRSDSSLGAHASGPIVDRLRAFLDEALS